jgi:hypothetical protein
MINTLIHWWAIKRWWKQNSWDLVEGSGPLGMCLAFSSFVVSVSWLPSCQNVLPHHRPISNGANWPFTETSELYAKIHLSFFYFFFGSTEVWTQGLSTTEAMPLAIFLLVIFQMGSHIFLSRPVWIEISHITENWNFFQVFCHSNGKPTYLLKISVK